MLLERAHAAADGAVRQPQFRRSGNRRAAARHRLENADGFEWQASVEGGGGERSAVTWLHSCPSMRWFAGASDVTIEP